MPTISDLLGEFTRARRGSGKKASGVQRYVDALRLFERWLEAHGVCDVAKIDDTLVSDFRDHCIEDRGNKPSTVEKRLTAIRALAYGR